MGFQSDTGLTYNCETKQLWVILAWLIFQILHTTTQAKSECFYFSKIPLLFA